MAIICTYMVYENWKKAKEFYREFGYNYWKTVKNNQNMSETDFYIKSKRTEACTDFAS